MKWLETLKDEHRTIVTMLSIADAAASRLTGGEAVSPALFADALDFFANFEDGSHQAKEETLLFPLLAALGLAPDTNSLLSQHDASRWYLGDMRAALDRLRQGEPQATESLTNSIRAYVELARAHVSLEDEYFFPLAAQILSASEDRMLAARLAEIDARVCTRSADEQRYERLVSKYLALVDG